MNTAIIVAAGTGSRFAAAQPKQFTLLLDKPVLIHTLLKFDSSPLVDDIVLVLSEDGRGEFDAIRGGDDIKKLRSIVSGGATRAESVRNGLEQIDPAPDGVVAVHDGARPLVSVDEITRTIARAMETGAACLVCEVTDTIKEIEGENIVRTIERGRLRRALTPQAFRYEIIRRAFDGADLSESVTDECYLVERLGIDIATVEGNARNIKITRPEDILLAEALMAP